MNCPILMYHHIQAEDHAGLDLSVSRRSFERQINWLKAKGYTAVTVARLAAFLHGNSDLPEKPVLITFDDGYQSVWDLAKPVLDRAGYVATVYAVPKALGQYNIWDQNKSTPIWPCMTAETCKQLIASGWEIGAHGFDHQALTALDDRVLNKNLTSARDKLSEQLNEKVTTFCYPFGALNDRVKTAVKEAGYLAACAISPGTSSVTADIWALRRVYVKGPEGLTAFKRKVSSWYLSYRAWRKR